MNYKTIRVRFEEPICFLQIYRPEANNTINDTLIQEFNHLLSQCEQNMSVVVLEGLPEVFCFGADFSGISEDMTTGTSREHGPELMYEVWRKMAQGPYVTISLVKGKVNAGGVGFVAASDIVLADHSATFSLSELLFGLFPACVLPFLIRRVGFQKAHYLTLSTKPIMAADGYSMGLIDSLEDNADSLLRKHLLRLRRLSKTGVTRYKRFMNELDDSLDKSKQLALAANREIFSDPVNLEGIHRYVSTGQFPWEERK